MYRIDTLSALIGLSVSEQILSTAMIRRLGGSLNGISCEPRSVKIKVMIGQERIKQQILNYKTVPPLFSIHHHQASRKASKSHYHFPTSNHYFLIFADFLIKHGL